MQHAHALRGLPAALAVFAVLQLVGCSSDGGTDKNSGADNGTDAATETTADTVADTGGETSQTVEEETGELFEGAGQEKTTFTEAELDELVGTSRFLVAEKESAIRRLKLKPNVRFIMDLEKVADILSVKVTPDTIEVHFESLEARQRVVRAIKQRSHRYGASFTDRVFSKDAIVVGVAKKSRIPFARRIVSIEKDGLDVIVHTEPVRNHMDVFDKIQFKVSVPLNANRMVNKRKLLAEIKELTGRDVKENDMFVNAEGEHTTLMAEMIKRLESGMTLANETAPVAMASPKFAPGDVDLDDYRDPAGAAYCPTNTLIHTSLDKQLYPAGNASGPVKIGTGGCFSLGVSAVVEMNDADYFKAYVVGNEKMWLDLIFAANGGPQHIESTINLVEGSVPLYGSFFLGVAMTFGVDLSTSVDVDAGLSAVGGFNQQWSMKRGFEVKDGKTSKIVDKDDHFDIHPLKISGAVNIYGEIALKPYFGIEINVLFMEAASGGIHLIPYVYGEVDFKGEVYAGQAGLGDFTFETCYDLGYGIDWDYFIEGLFGAISYTSPRYEIVGRKSFLRGDSSEPMQCFPSNADGEPSTLTADQLEQISDDFNNCLDWSEGWENSDSQTGAGICWMTGDNHYTFMTDLGGTYDDQPARWGANGQYTLKYDSWDIGGDSVDASEEEDWADIWIALMTGTNFDNAPPDSYVGIYGAADERDLYAKHKPKAAGGAIQSLIDTACEEQANKFIWTDFKRQLCAQIWDWFQDGYYGASISLVTTEVQDTLGSEVYDPATGTWTVDEDAQTAPYLETRLQYDYDPDDPDHELLRTRRWSPEYCFDWYKVAQKSTVPSDMEWFLDKCKFTIIDEPEANPDKVVGENRLALYDKISEAYCEHPECPISNKARELCPGGLAERDGTQQAERRKGKATYDPVDEEWDSAPAQGLCASVLDPGNVVVDDPMCGPTLAHQVHCDDDCNTVPYCSIYDKGTVFCTAEYWEELRRLCRNRGFFDPERLRELIDADLTKFVTNAYRPEAYAPENQISTRTLLENHFKAMGGAKLLSMVVESPEITRSFKTNCTPQELVQKLLYNSGDCQIQ